LIPWPTSASLPYARALFRCQLGSNGFGKSRRTCRCDGSQQEERS
jgi:hypothetical protein